MKSSILRLTSHSWTFLVPGKRSRTASLYLACSVLPRRRTAAPGWATMTEDGICDLIQSRPVLRLI
jgi:hypothetical protein